VAFKVPTASTQAAVTSASDSDVRPELHEPTAEGSKLGLGSSTTLSAYDADAVSETHIVFLCPNGHKLTCSPNLQGKPGKCPHCGAKFLIPDYEGDDEEGVDAESGFGSSANGQFAFDFSSLTDEEPAADAAQAASHAMARLFVQLWRQRGDAGTIELYLKGGERLVPHHFSPGLSRERYGMFAVQDEDGRYTLTAIHWDTVERVAVSGVEGLPHGMFDE